jgi:hypothetical protein
VIPFWTSYPPFGRCPPNWIKLKKRLDSMKLAFYNAKRRITYFLNHGGSDTTGTFTSRQDGLRLG